MAVEDTGAVYKDLVYLVACAINKVTPDHNRIAHLDLDELFLIAKRHSLQSITAVSLENAGINRNEFIQEKWKAIRNELAFDNERSIIIASLEKAGIWYLPLKGIVIKDFYPQIGMRQMTDNDILFDSTKEKTVDEIMVGFGYDLEEAFAIHNTYYKKPIFNFEMHKALYPEDSRIYDYYKDIKGRLIKDSDNQYGYHFSDEDFYIFMIAHEYKHFSGKGTGLRSLLDVFLYLRERSSSLDWRYINSELEKLELTGFERTNRRLAENIFSGEEISSEETKELVEILRSGTYGSINNQVQRLGGGIVGKIGYVFSRLFLPIESVKAYYPVFYNIPLLLPLLPVYRLFCGLADKKRRERIKKQLTTLLKR